MAYNYMTQAGYDKLIAEINELESVHRPEISRQIAEARDKGDLSENAEYDAAKEAQGLLEGKIAQLKAQVANARIIDESKISTDSVQILSKVTIRNTKTGAELTYTLVSDTAGEPQGEEDLRQHPPSLRALWAARSVMSSRFRRLVAS